MPLLNEKNRKVSMKNFGFIVFSVLMLMASGFANADETVKETVTAGAKTTKRGINKGKHIVRKKQQLQLLIKQKMRKIK